jgi:predicted nuclease of restriction endonuclease-like (RecB) superfamily
MAGKRKALPKPEPNEDVQPRSSRGRKREGVSFPAPPLRASMPSGYVATLNEIKERIRTERLRVALSANAAMVLMYWEIGKIILFRQEEEGWGAKVIDRLSSDLREEFPDMQGLSPRNLLFMRSFAAAYFDAEIVKQLVSQLPWGHIIHLLQRVKDHDARSWYARASIANGWSRSILDLQIQSQAYQRQGKAVNNFAMTLPPADSDMSAQVFKDPYLFDFIGTADLRREAEVEQALVDHIQKFLLELGAGFAFVGRQVHLEFSSADYYLDLLFYHLKLRCFVVVELKAVPFQPEFTGKLNMYMSAVDDLLRHPDDKPTIGLLLCKGKERIVAEYALTGFNRPIGVADWKVQLTETLPKELKGSLPTVEEIEAELAEVVTKKPKRTGGRKKEGGAE